MAGVWAPGMSIGGTRVMGTRVSVTGRSICDTGVTNAGVGAAGSSIGRAGIAWRAAIEAAAAVSGLVDAFIPVPTRPELALTALLEQPVSRGEVFPLSISGREGGLFHAGRRV